MIQFDVDVRPALTALGGMERQWPFAASKALNDTALIARDRIRDLDPFNAGTGLIFKSPHSKRYFAQQVQVTEYAKKQSLQATLQLRGPGATMFGRHEDGGTHTRMADDPFFIPTKRLRPTVTSIIPKALFPKALRLVTSRYTGAENAQRKGKQRTFMIRSASGPFRGSGIYQRTGPGPRQITLLWMFRPRVTLKPTLRFVRNATQVFTSEFPEQLREALAYAMSTAKR